MESYIKSESLAEEGTVVIKKLFILFPESKEFDPRVEEEILRCTTQFLRSIERHPEEGGTLCLHPAAYWGTVHWLVDDLRLQKEANPK